MLYVLFCFFEKTLQVGYVLCSNCKVFKCVTFPNFNDSQNWIGQQLSFSHIMIPLVSNKDRFSCSFAFFTLFLSMYNFTSFRGINFIYWSKVWEKKCFTVISFLYLMDYCKWCESKKCKSWSLIMLCVLDAHCKFSFSFSFWI